MKKNSEFKEPKPYNPLDKRRLAESTVRGLLASPPEPLPPSLLFLGAGIYAIYYCGDFPLYKNVSSANKGSYEQPIYIGKAVPPGGRKGGSFDKTTRSSALHKRLLEHAESIRQASNLNLENFRCRYLVVDELWIRLTESLLINMFHPLWNVVVDGFGNHDPGKGRYQGKRPNWDTLHPGRSWAKRLQSGAKTIQEIENSIREHLSG